MRYKTVLYILPLMVFLAALGSVGVREAEAPTPITIAVGVPLSGNWSGQGEEIVRAAEFAVQEINEDGGVLGSRLTVVIGDTEADPHRASALARKWIEDPSVVAQIGGFTSASALAAQRLYDATGMVQISPAVGHPAYAVGSPWSFSMMGLQEGEGKTNARFAFSQLRARRAAILYRDGEWGRRQAAEFSAEFRALGGSVVTENYFFVGDSGYSRLVERIRQRKPDLLYLATKEEEGSRICRELTMLPEDAPILLGSSKLHSLHFLQFAGPDAEGVYLSSFFVPEIEESSASSFYHRFRGFYGTDPGYLAALTYDAVYLAIEAIRAAGSRERAAVQKALLEIEGFSGVTGTIGFNRDGNAIRDYQHLRVEAGQFVSPGE